MIINGYRLYNEYPNEIHILIVSDYDRKILTGEIKEKLSNILIVMNAIFG